jgi:hypothetical protein
MVDLFHTSCFSVRSKADTSLSPLQIRPLLTALMTMVHRFAGTSSDQGAEDDLRFAIRDSASEDRFWAENRVVEFCAMTNAKLPPSLS